ncbi:Calx-beta domain-containing protein [Sphaerospermopsis aphanizomenoides]|uniref:Calx-beta domain-containing protein n=1 Tax=Sphaerospermopsis aphanizomenoides TaxID=459663 RepID=UPI001F43EDB1|nr:Calx-beta domain-containing protein [Sphaerospermopsis aphanizomenoides]
MPGSTLLTAENIGVLTSYNYNDSISSTSPLDYYKFSLTSTNNITLQLSGVTQNYLAATIIYDSNNNGIIDTDDDIYYDYWGPSRTSPVINATLGAGNYYIEISQYYDYSNSNYSLQLSATSAPPSIASNPGNTLGTAYNLGNLTGTQTITEFVGSADRLDYYKFSLTSTNNITLKLNGVTQNYLAATIYYDSNNNGLIDTDDDIYYDYWGPSRTSPVINTTLGAGNYYIGISQYYDYSNSNYSLQLSATSAPPSIASDPGNTLGTAYNLGNLAGTQTITEFVGSADRLDYYKFSLTSTNDISLQLSGVTQNYLYATIYYDSNNNGLIDSGEQVYSNYAGPTRNVQTTQTLQAGNYYVGISQYYNYSNSNYSLTLVNITNPNPTSTVTLAVSPSSVTENGTTNLVYTFTRTGSTTNALTVNYSIAGTATSTDYTGATPGTGKTITFAAGSSTATLVIDPTGDTIVESNETVALTLVSGTGYTVGTTTAVTGTITNDDVALPTITLAVSPSSVTENGTTNLVYTFTRTGSTTNALTVNYSIAGTAASTDYTGATPGTGKTITFAAGSSTATLTIDPTGDTTVESNETVALTLATGTGYTIGTTTAVTGTITNDDVAPSVTINLSADQTIVEGLTSPQNVRYTVTLSAASSQTITVNYTTSNGTAIAGSDYTTKTGTLTFAPNTTSQFIDIPIINDANNEANETFIFTLSSPTNASLGSKTTATTTITDTLSASVTTTLAAGVENLTLTGTTAINGTGNAGNNVLTGNTANNVLTGGNGNDTYAFVANSALGTDTITEVTTGGTDTLDFTGTTAAVNVNLGVATTQTVNSNLKLILSANNVIENATGSAANDRITGNSLGNLLVGAEGSDLLQGLAGNDILSGGLGDDFLNGGVGNDEFRFQGNGVFNANLGADYITLFEVGQDKIALSKATFNAITNAAGQALTDFAVVANNGLVDASNARIVYSQETGSIFYNQNGNVLGAASVFEFAYLGNPDATLSSSDFLVIA